MDKELATRLRVATDNAREAEWTAEEARAERDALILAACESLHPADVASIAGISRPSVYRILKQCERDAARSVI